MSVAEGLNSDRLTLREKISRFPEAMEGAPSSWWRQTARTLMRFERELGDFSDPAMRAYFQTQIDRAKAYLRTGASRPAGNDSEIAHAAEDLIMQLSMEMAIRFEPKIEEMETHFIGLADLTAMHPDRFQTHRIPLNGGHATILRVKHPVEDSWQEIPLPENEKIWHKGGPARAVLNAVANAPLSMQKSEFPWNDLDVVVAGDEQRGAHVSCLIGVDPEGIEHMGEEDLNFERFCLGRDTEQNQVCLGADGLYFSEAAYQSSLTGHVDIVGEYMANKAIYGTDKVVLDSITMAKARGLMRLVKVVVEGKALSFPYKPVNANLDMGIYSLFLARKWAKKDRFPEYMQRMYEVLRQMGQVRQDEKNMRQVLERAHREYPFFNFDSDINDFVDLVRWKSRKLAKQVDRETAWQFGLPTDLKLERRPGDDQPYNIFLNGFQPDAAESAEAWPWWERFLEESKARTARFEASGVTYMQRLFIKSEEINDAPPDNIRLE